MLKESPQEQGCLKGCLVGLLLGGGAGSLLGYWLGGRTLSGGEAGIFKFAYASVGLLAGWLFVSFLTFLYYKFFVKVEEEEI